MEIGEFDGLYVLSKDDKRNQQMNKTRTSIVKNTVSSAVGAGAARAAAERVATPAWLAPWVFVDPCPNPIVDLAVAAVAAASFAVSWAFDKIIVD